MDVHEEQEVVTLSEICRVCLVKTNSMKHLLEPNNEITSTITKLLSVSNIQIEINDILPCFLCNNCEEKLKISYDFQQLCQKSHNFILSCLSSSSVSFKVNSFKPLPFVDTSDKSGIQSLDNNTDNFASFIDSDGIIKKVLISCFSIPDVNCKENSGIVKENLENIQALDIVKGKCGDAGNVFGPGKSENVPQPCALAICDSVKDEKIYINAVDHLNGTDEKPREVEKKTIYNQTMRLPQFSGEAVQKVMEQFRERYMKHINCLHCGFTARHSRALSLHMTRIHKELRGNWCFWCNDHFNNLREHIDTFHKDSFKCPLCGKYIANSGHFMEHLASHSTERKFVCTECCKCFISLRHLRLHLRGHKRRNPYGCQLCPKTFKRPTTLDNHLKTHKKHKCKLCKERFTTLTEYTGHECFSNSDPKKDIVNTEEEFVDVESKQEESSEKIPQNFCKTCNKRVRSLEKHMSTMHSDSVKNEDKKLLKALCSYCGKRFKTPGILAIHVRLHTGELPYKCSYCDKRTRTKIQLVSHERTHTGERPHKCKFCKKAFAQTSVLNTHMKQHTGRSEECFMCHKKFCRPSELKMHMRIHTGEKPYECKICGQQFAQQGRLTEHTRHHTNEKPFKCEYCEKSFKQTSTLKSHMNIHLGKKPFQCSQCSYASRHSHCLKQHMLQHESEVKIDQLHKCEMCGQSFLSLEVYSLHCRNQHGSLDAEAIVKDGLIETSTVTVIDHLQEFT